MTTKIWVGGTESFDDPLAWSPWGVPGEGDTAIIQTGTAIAQHQTLRGFELQLRSPASVLDVRDVMFAKDFTLAVPPGPGGSATVHMTGSNVNNGTIEATVQSPPPEFAPSLTINIGDAPAGERGVFVNNGTIAIESGQPFDITALSPDALFINNGLMHLDAPFLRARIGVAMQGGGTIETGHSITPAYSGLLLVSIPFVEFAAAVGSGESLVFSRLAHVAIDEPLQFHALIHGFQPFTAPTPPTPPVYAFFQPEIILPDTQVTSCRSA